MRISRVLRTCTCSGGSLGVRVLLEIRNSSGWTCMTVRCKTGPVCSVGLYCTLSKGASVWNCLGESVQAYVLFCHHRWENKTLFRWEENLCPICSTFFFSAEAIWNTRYTQFGSVFLILLEIQWKTIPMFIATCSCHEITLVVAAWRGWNPPAFLQTFAKAGQMGKPSRGSSVA